MTPAEQRAWCALLGPTPQAQLAVLRSLLRHARQDGMSASDRAICRAQQTRLGRVLGVPSRRRRHARTRLAHGYFAPEPVKGWAGWAPSAAHLYQAGASTVALAALYQTSTGTVNRAIQSVGVALRTTKEAWAVRKQGGTAG